MAVRPVDLQQTVLRSSDASRETPAQQEQSAAATQQTAATNEARRQAHQAETVRRFDEAGLAAVHEREARSNDRGQTGERDTSSGDDDQAADGAAQATLAAQPRLGRHVDLQA